MSKRKMKKTIPRRIKRSINPDLSVPEMTMVDFLKARPVKDILPGLIAAAKRARGRPRSPSPKQHISLRLDAGVIAGYKVLGKGWQRKINEVLLQGLTESNANASAPTTETIGQNFGEQPRLQATVLPFVRPPIAEHVHSNDAATDYTSWKSAQLKGSRS